MIRSVTSVRTVVQPPSGYRFTVFGGLHADSGPTTLEELNSVTDLYHKFNTFNPHSSYKMIERILNMGYRVQALRTELSNNRISCRRFDSAGSIIYSHPEFNRDYSKTTETDLNSGVYSQSLTFGDTPLGDFLFTYNNYKNLPNETYIVVEHGERLITLCFGRDEVGVSESNIMIYDNLSAEESPDIYLSNLTFAHLRENYEDLYGNLRLSILEEFFTFYCGFKVTKVDQKNWIISSSTRFTPITTCTIPDITFRESETGNYDKLCELYEGKQVLTFYSKYDKNVEDTIVTITKSIDAFIVTAQQFNVKGSIIYQEIYKVSTIRGSHDFIETINDKSDLIYVEYHLDDSSDISGTYNLKRTSPISHQDLNFLNSLVTNDVSGFPDIVIDNYPGFTRDERQSYLQSLRSRFNNTVILTDYLVNLKDMTRDRICCVQPDITWFDTNDSLRGYSYLLYLLPKSGEGGDTGLFFHNEANNEASEINFILREDYKYLLSKSLVKLNNVLQVKNVITLFAIQNEFARQLSAKRLADISDLDNMLASVVSLISSYTESKINVSILSSSITGRNVKVDIQAKINTEIIDRYSLSITLTQQGG